MGADDERAAGGFEGDGAAVPLGYQGREGGSRCHPVNAHSSASITGYAGIFGESTRALDSP